MTLRSILVCLVASLVVASAALLTADAGSSSGGGSTPQVGISYGGHTAQHEPVWVRLTARRNWIADLELSWTAPAGACTDHPSHPGATFSGGENESPVRVVRGFFRRTEMSASEGGGTRAFETVRISGTVTAAQ